MKTIDYTYQETAANQILEDALNSNYLAAVLAACPSSGKTTISHIIINKYLQMFPNGRVLVLTEGQKTLQNQYLAELDNANVEITFNYGLIGSEAQVQVGLPQSINKLKWNKVDLLIVDECHNWYLENTDQDIIRKFSPSHQVIMTGSPSKFNLHNQTKSTKYGMYYISAEKLQKMGVFSGVDMDVIKTKNKNGIKSIWNEAVNRGADMSKVMVACSSILQANTVSYLLRQIGRNCIISTSQNDKDSSNIQDFKNGEYDVLIVVNRGILGFNDKMVTTLLDLKSSKNVDSSYQLFARILRVHPEGRRKYYFRLSTGSVNKEVVMLHKMVALMKDSNFKKFNGGNFQVSIG